MNDSSKVVSNLGNPQTSVHPFNSVTKGLSAGIGRELSANNLRLREKLKHKSLHSLRKPALEKMLWLMI